MDITDLETIENEYNLSKNRYEKFCIEVVKQLNELISSASIIPALPIQYRVKSFDSILDKILKTKRDSIRHLSDFPDIAGIRIVLLFERDIDKVVDIIDSNFSVLSKEDTRKRLGDSEFGYGSIHYEVKTPSEWLKVPSLKPLEKITGEIQVRTAAQHIWAAASHVLQYKNKSDVPSPLRRSINRAAALLETVDLEFERVLAKRDAYASGVDTEDPSETLNTETLKKSLLNLLPIENISEGEEYSDLLEELKHFGITTTGSLKKLMTDTLESVLKKESKHVSEGRRQLAEIGQVSGTSPDRITRGVYFNFTGLVRQAISEKYGRDVLLEYWQSQGVK